MLREDYQCRQCQTFFIPFNEDIQCPRCMVRATEDAIEEHARFILDLVLVMQLNKARKGVFIPDEWPIGLLVNSVQLLMFEMFDALEQEKPKNKKKFFEKNIKSMALEGGDEFDAHLLDIALAVSELRIERGLDCINGN